MYKVPSTQEFFPFAACGVKTSCSIYLDLNKALSGRVSIELFEPDFWVWSVRSPSCRTGKGITLTTPHTWTKVPIPRLPTTTTPCMTTLSSAGRACGGSSTTAHRTDSKEAIPEVTGHLVPPEGAAGVSSSPLFSSAWGCSGRSSVLQSTFQTKVQ